MAEIENKQTTQHCSGNCMKCNPFQRAYEVMSKSVDAPTLKIIQDTIAEQKYDMSIAQAISIFKGPLKEYVKEHDGKVPSVDSPNPKYREMAIALQKIKNMLIVPFLR